MESQITLTKIKKYIKSIYPLYFKNDKKWFDEGFDICKNMIISNGNTLEAIIFAINYYIANFNQEHFVSNFKYNKIFNKVLYPSFFCIYNVNNDKLIVINSKIKNIALNNEITFINEKPVLDYLKEFILFNSGNIYEKSDYIKHSINMFLNYNNPYLTSPKNITINNKIIDLNYVNISHKDVEKELNNIIKYNNYLKKITYNLKNNKYKIKKINTTIYLKINSFFNIKYNDLINLIDDNVNKIIIDLRYNTGGDIKNVVLFYKIVYGLSFDYGYYYKDSIYTNYKDISFYRCIKPKLKRKIIKPELDIIVNEYSLSACKLFVAIAKYYIKNIKIIGNINIYPICGNYVNIKLPNNIGYLEIPSVCNFCNEII
jgi:hypothetical protein